jgi:hypothetical protein
VERLKFLQDGSLARAVSGVNRQVYPPGIPVPAALGDDRQEFDLTIGKRFGRQDYLDRLTSRIDAGRGVFSLGGYDSSCNMRAVPELNAVVGGGAGRIRGGMAARCPRCLPV